jgi:hypothetical protein
MHNLKLEIIPDPEDKEAAEVYVEAYLEGKKYPFLLDTGAAITTINYDPYTSRFPSTKTHKSSGVFANIQSDLIQVPELKIGSIRKKNITLARHPKDQNQRRNILGMDILKHFCCMFRFDKQEILLGDSSEFDLGHTLYDLILDNKYHPYVDLSWGDEKLKAVWDTGAGMTIVDIQFIASHVELFKLIGESTGMDASGTQSKTPLYDMQGPKIGKEYFPSHKIAAVDFSHIKTQAEIPMDMILGYTTLKYGQWLFNFPHKKWTILQT